MQVRRTLKTHYTINVSSKEIVMAKSEKRLPAPGDRVGFVDGPGVFPQDRAGVVQVVRSDRWYSHIADVLMDDGSMQSWIGGYDVVGIGCYLLEAA